MRSTLIQVMGSSVIGLITLVAGLPAAQAKLPQATRRAAPPAAASTAPQPDPASAPTAESAPPPPATLDSSLEAVAPASTGPSAATLSYPPLLPPSGSSTPALSPPPPAANIGLMPSDAASGMAPSDSAAPPLSAPPAMLLSDPATTEDSQPSERANGDARQFGAMFDLGVPDGTMLSFVYRPISLARLHAGAGYNGVSPGLRLGAALLPFGAGPSVSLDYGHYFEGDANGLAGLVGNEKGSNVLLQRVGYDFVNLRAGMELGGDRFTFFARGGISWIRTTIHEFESLLTPSGDASNGNTSISVTEDPVLSAFVPSLQLGLIVQF